MRISFSILFILCVINNGVMGMEDSGSNACVSTMERTTQTCESITRLVTSATKVTLLICALGGISFTGYHLFGWCKNTSSGLQLNSSIAAVQQGVTDLAAENRENHDTTQKRLRVGFEDNDDSHHTTQQQLVVIGNAVENSFNQAQADRHHQTSRLTDTLNRLREEQDNRQQERHKQALSVIVRENNQTRRHVTAERAALQQHSDMNQEVVMNELQNLQQTLCGLTEFVVRNLTGRSNNEALTQLELENGTLRRKDTLNNNWFSRLPIIADVFMGTIQSN